MRYQIPAVAVALALLASCTSPQDIQTARQAEVAGAAFEAALYAGYLDLADDEAAQADWVDADFYYEKALAVGQGDAVAPEQLADWALPDDALPDLEAAREALITVLDRGGRELAPDDSAEALVAFDCWVEQQEENFQTDDISECRGHFEAALARAQDGTSGVIAVLLPSEGEEPTAISFATAAGQTVIDSPLSATQVQAAAEAPEPAVALSDRTVDALFGDAIAAQPDDPVDYVLYFETGTATLTAESAEQIDDVIAFAQGRPVTSVRVVGHTDTVGSPAVNARLSLRRAQQVRDLLVEAGLEAAAIDVFSLGESDPLVPTPDNTPEERNRRVVVTVR